MGARNPAVNAQTRVVTDYGPDPADGRARGLIGDLVARMQGYLVPAVVGANGDPSTSFFGYGPELQKFTGAAGAGNGVVYTDGAYPDISSGIVEGPYGDPARRIFAARLKRGRS